MSTQTTTTFNSMADFLTNAALGEKFTEHLPSGIYTHVFINREERADGERGGNVLTVMTSPKKRPNRIVSFGFVSSRSTKGYTTTQSLKWQASDTLEIVSVAKITEEAVAQRHEVAVAMTDSWGLFD